MSGEYLEIGRVTRFHLKLLIMLMLGWSFDSMNSGLVSFLLKQIVREWGLSPEIAGFMLSSWLVGMLVGAFVMGSLGDILGHKAIMITSLIAFSLPAAYALLPV
ncbi:MAG: hypothetical protein DRJ44_07220 [Thermoprotei archaeon]|nr:MAG: hypothetical protein DRJ44_07220 [Thermoprotei archaeon]